MLPRVTDNRKIGIGLTCFGSFFLILGMILLFDQALLALGNVLFVTGIILLIGVRNATKFFFRRVKLRGTLCFLLGIGLLLWGWPMIGMLVELFGVLNLFGNFFPVILVLLRQTPLVGHIMRIPIIDKCIEKIMGADSSILPVHQSQH